MIWWQLLLVIAANFVSIMASVVFVNWLNIRGKRSEIRKIMDGIMEKVENDMNFSDIVNRNFGANNDERDEL